MADYNADQMSDESEERFGQIAEDGNVSEVDKQLKVGYLVGITPQGKFVFNVVGGDQTLDGLVASHRHATDVVDQVWDSKFKRGGSVQNLIANTLVQLNNKLDMILKSEPENKL